MGCLILALFEVISDIIFWAIAGAVDAAVVKPTQKAVSLRKAKRERRQRRAEREKLNG